MLDYQTNPKKKVYNIDFDGTLAYGSYRQPLPNHETITKVKDLFHKGHVIIIWTARQWREASGLVAWLIKNEVPFHGIMMGKGGSDCYVDDKAVNAKDF